MNGMMRAVIVVLVVLVLPATTLLPAVAQEPVHAPVDPSRADSLATAPVDSSPTPEAPDAEVVFRREYDAWLARFGSSDVVASWVRIETILEVDDGRVISFKGRFTRPFKMSGVGSVFNSGGSDPLIQVPGEIQAGSEVIIFHAFRRVGFGGRDTITIPFAMRIAK